MHFSWRQKNWQTLLGRNWLCFIDSFKSESAPIVKYLGALKRDWKSQRVSCSLGTIREVFLVLPRFFQRSQHWPIEMSMISILSLVAFVLSHHARGGLLEDLEETKNLLRKSFCCHRIVTILWDRGVESRKHSQEQSRAQKPCVPLYEREAQGSCSWR